MKTCREVQSLKSMLKVDRRGIMERKFQRDGLTCTKAQGPKIPSHVVLLEHEMEVGVEADFTGGREGTNAKRARL